MRAPSHGRGDPDRFYLGFVSGVIVTVLGAAGLRGAMWLSQWGVGRTPSELGSAMMAGLQTPVLSVMDVLGVVLLILVALIVIQMPRYLRGGA